MRMSLSECCTIVMGQSPDSVSYNSEGKGMPFYQGKADFGEIHPVTRIWCSKPLKIANKGDILLSVRAPIGALNIASNESCIGRGLAAIRSKKEKCINGYIYYYLQSRVNELILKGTGSTFKAINRGVLEELVVPVLTISEQIKIANVFILIDRMVGDAKKQLLDLNLMVKSRFIEMFGDPIKNDKGWPTDSVENVCDNIYGGGTPSKSKPEYWNGVIPWVSSKDMKGEIISDSQLKITEEGLENSSAKMVPVNSIIMVIRSGILKHTLPVAINIVPITVNQDLKVFIPSQRMSTKFMAFLFKMLEKDILSGVRAVTADNIEFDTLKKRNVIVPPIELQNQFADFVAQVDKSKLAVQQSLNELETLKKSLMQQYFG